MLYVSLDDWAEEIPFDEYEDTSDWLIEVEKLPEADWLKEALFLNVYWSDSPEFRDIVDRVFDEVSGLTKITSQKRSRDALKTVLLNLWVSDLMGAPVRYSRRKNNYVRDSRYGQLFMKRDRLIPVIDTLERLGYISQKGGWQDRDTGVRRQTRMWGTRKLWHLFKRSGLVDEHIVLPPEPEELIILRDTDKEEIGYRETIQTRKQREQLEHYNQFLKEHEITVDLLSDCEVDNRFLVVWLLNNILTGRAGLLHVDLVLTLPTVNPYIQPVLIPRSPYQIPPVHIPKDITKLQYYYYLHPSITDTDYGKPITLLGSQESRLANFAFLEYLQNKSVSTACCDNGSLTKQMLEQTFQLKEIGVERLLFRLNAESLHRVYNRGSFKYNGRAYGALHQMMPKQMRPYIHIDGRPTIELDYAALHIRMLYHKERIDYQQDPYVVPGGPELRKVFKAVGLIAINVKTEKTAYGPIRQELKDRNIPLPNFERPLITSVEMFKKAHKPIEKYLFSNAGIWLQNLDSRIMNSILMRLKDSGILGLSVHDSVIVQKEHEGILREIMIQEYETVMGFKPKF
ncbi:hypothetical protein ES702_03771 [subsurface metagenome]